jgi:O-glycosyl hydrolase
MSKKDKNSLGYLGQQFQLKFLGQLLTDSKFANSIMEIVKPEYFEGLRKMYLKVTTDEDKVKILTAMGHLAGEEMMEKIKMD